jgi:hypothetical protein
MALNIAEFSEAFHPKWQLRPYQCEVAEQIVRSVEQGAGRQFAVVFARQSGKDEMLAQLEAYLMWHYRSEGGSLIVATPTYRPQGLIARRRLLARLDSLMTGGYTSDGHTLALERATCAFLSANPLAQARGETIPATQRSARGVYGSGASTWRSSTRWWASFARRPPMAATLPPCAPTCMPS